jgi:POT family proton-dependent oligopeptide transporter
LFYCFIFQIVGGAFLIFNNYYLLIIGLTLFLISTGLNVPILDVIIINKTRGSSKNNEKAFLWSYGFVNIGFIVGFSISGIAQLSLDYSTLFVYSEIFSFISLLTLIFGWNLMQVEISKKLYTTKYRLLNYFLVSEFKRLILLFIITFIFVCLILYGYNFAYYTKYFTIVFACCLIFWLYKHALKIKKTSDKNKFLVFLHLSMFALIFWIMHFLSPMSLMVFAHKNVDLMIWSVTIPPQWLQNVENVTIIICSFFFPTMFDKIREKTNLSFPVMYSVSILIMALGFLNLATSIVLARDDGYVNVIWILVFYCMQGIAETVFSTIGLSMINDLVCEKDSGMMIGFSTFLRGGFTTVIASFLSSSVNVSSKVTNPLLTNNSYLKLYFSLAIIALFSSLALFLMRKRLSLMVAGIGFFKRTKIQTND